MRQRMVGDVISTRSGRDSHHPLQRNRFNCLNIETVFYCTEISFFLLDKNIRLGKII